MVTNSESETFEVLEKVLSTLHKAFWSAVQDSHFERDIQESLSTMQITNQLTDGKFFQFIFISPNHFVPLTRNYHQFPVFLC